MLHATGVSDAVVPSVHFELEAALHREGFSRRVHLGRACGVGETKKGIRTREWLLNWMTCGRPSCKKKRSRLRKKTCRKKKYRDQLRFIPRMENSAFLTQTNSVLLFSSAYPLRERILGLWKSSQSKWIVKDGPCERWLGWLGVFAPHGPSLKNPSQQYKNTHTHPEIRLDFVVVTLFKKERKKMKQALLRIIFVYQYNNLNNLFPL